MIISMNANISSLESKYKKAFSLGGPLQIYIDSTVLSGVERYVPMDTGELSNSAKSNTKPGDGKITWSTSYARYLWFGKSAKGNDLNYDLSRNALAGPMWAERYKADNLMALRDSIAKKVRSI